MSGTDDSLLSDDDFNELQAIADRFADERKKGPIADWNPYLPPSDAKLRRQALIECIKVDLEVAWKKEGGIRCESYLDRFPELNALPIEVIVEEYRVRHLFGDKPSLDDFAFRFPDQYPEFHKRVEKILIERSAPKFAKGGSGPAPSLESLFPPGYKPGEFIGRGNFAEVWRAERPAALISRSKSSPSRSTTTPPNASSNHSNWSKSSSTRRCSRLRHSGSLKIAS